MTPTSTPTPALSVTELLQIAEETRDYYAADPVGRRGLDALGHCAYSVLVKSTLHPLAPEERCCAVGRLMSPAERDYVRRNWFNPTPIRSLAHRIEIDSAAPQSKTERDSFHGYPIWFLELLQGFHDHNANWTATGLSAQGEGEYARVLTIIRDTDARPQLGTYVVL